MDLMMKTELWEWYGFFKKEVLESGGSVNEIWGKSLGNSSKHFNKIVWSSGK